MFFVLARIFRIFLHYGMVRLCEIMPQSSEIMPQQLHNSIFQKKKEFASLTNI